MDQYDVSFELLQQMQSTYHKYPNIISLPFSTSQYAELPFFNPLWESKASDRRSSINSSVASLTPDLFSSAPTCDTSPVTPISGMSFSFMSDTGHTNHNTTPATNVENHHTYDFNDCNDLMCQDISAPIMIRQPPIPVDDPILLGEIHAAPVRISFDKYTQNLELPPKDHDAKNWSNSSQDVLVQTIVPSITFRVQTPSTPIWKHEPVTPLESETGSVTFFKSSPFSAISPPVLPSQKEADDRLMALTDGISSEDEIAEMEYDDDKCEGLPDVETLQSTQIRKSRKTINRRGLNFVSIVERNMFPCKYPDCIDKRTSLQKSFKRQEHKKRHERSVHEKKANFPCWVPNCKTQPFTRHDNLRAHLRNTHGKRSPNQRNRYVATLDKHSNYYDPDWVGDLTENGYPVQ